MLRYQKGPEPAPLREIRGTPGASWESIGEETRGPVREALRRDQDGLCAYCEQRPRELRIEHWQARADGGAPFAWRNLLGVCLGMSGARAELHCDASRGAHTLFLHPVEGEGPDPRLFLRWSGDGRVAAEDRRAAHDIETLNLNHRELVRRRLAALDTLRSLKRRGLTGLEARVAQLEFREMLRSRLARWERAAEPRG